MDTWLSPADLPRLGDLLAIPFFLLLAAYFALKGLRRLKPLEIILFLFAITGAAADIYFVFGPAPPRGDNRVASLSPA